MQVDYNIINASDAFLESEKLIDSQKYMVYGGLLMFIMFFLMFGSGWIIEERENGTLKRLKTVKNGFVISFWASFCLVISGVFQAAIFILINTFLRLLYLMKSVYLLHCLYLLSLPHPLQYFCIYI